MPATTVRQHHHVPNIAHGTTVKLIRLTSQPAMHREAGNGAGESCIRIASIVENRYGSARCAIKRNYAQRRPANEEKREAARFSDAGTV